MGAQQSRSLHGFRPHHHKEKRSGQSGESSEGREGGHRYGTHQTQKQVEAEKSGVAPSDASFSDATWASSSTRAAPAYAAPSPDHSQPSRQSPLGGHRNQARDGGDSSGDGPEVDRPADRMDVSSLIKLLYVTLIITNRSSASVSPLLPTIIHLSGPFPPPTSCSSSPTKAIEKWPLQLSLVRSASCRAVLIALDG